MNKSGEDDEHDDPPLNRTCGESQPLPVKSLELINNMQMSSAGDVPEQMRVRHRQAVPVLQAPGSTFHSDGSDQL